MTSIWDTYSKDAEKGTGGDWPEVPDDLYTAMVKDISEPTTEPDMFNPGKERTQFYITWELESDDLPEGTTLRQYLTIPEGYLNDGYLNEKSGLYKVMEALGYDMNARFRVDPRAWQGMEARVMVENQVPKGKGEDDRRPRITGVKPKRGKANKGTNAAPARETVTAGARQSFRDRARTDDAPPYGDDE